MFFYKYALLALPFIGSTLAAPTGQVPTLALTKKNEITVGGIALEKRQDAGTDSLVEVITDVASSVEQLLADLSSSSSSSQITSILQGVESLLESALSSVSDSSSTGSSSATEDIDTIAATLSQLIQEILSGLESVQGELENGPLLLSIVTQIDGTLNLLLNDLEAELPGILSTVSTLLTEVIDLLDAVVTDLLPQVLATLGKSSTTTGSLPAGL